MPCRCCDASVLPGVCYICMKIERHLWVFGYLSFTEILETKNNSITRQKYSLLFKPIAKTLSQNKSSITQGISHEGEGFLYPTIQKNILINNNQGQGNTTAEKTV